MMARPAPGDLMCVKGSWRSSFHHGVGRDAPCYAGWGRTVMTLSAAAAPLRFTLAVLLAVLALPAAAAVVDVYLFWRIGCPHCERAIDFLDRVAAANPDVRLHK